MTEIEVPLEKVQEHIEHAAKHGAGHGEGQDRSWITWSALLSAILAVAAAVAALLPAGASDHTHGTRPRPRYGAVLGARVMSPSARSDPRARRMEAMRL